MKVGDRVEALQRRESRNGEISVISFKVILKEKAVCGKL